SHAATSSSTSSGACSRKAWSTLRALKTSIRRKRGLASSRASTTWPSSRRRRGWNAAKLIRTWNATRVRSGSTVNGPARRATSSTASKHARTCGTHPSKSRLRSPSGPQAWVWLRFAKGRPQAGHVHMGDTTGGSCHPDQRVDAQMTLSHCTCIRSCETEYGQHAHLRLALPFVAVDARRILSGHPGRARREAALGSARHAVGGRPVAVGLRGPGGGGLRVEANGINVIVDAERRGRARELFWPWFGANVSVLGLSYGAFALGFGISFWQAAITGLIGIVFSFLLCGFVALAGKRGSAPTMVLSRAAFGVRGNRL